MVRVFVCKNDGCFELEPANVPLEPLASWSDVKMQLARVLYCEEELFAVASAAEIALYRLPGGESIAELVEHNDIDATDVDAASDADAQQREIAALLVSDSRWVLDIFSCPVRRMSDLTQQTDHAIRGMRKSNFVPLGRRMSAMPSSSLHSNSTANALGNERLDTATTTTAATGVHPHRSASAVVTAINSVSSNSYHEPYIHIGTWVPLMVTDKSKSNASEYEDVLVTTHRAREYVNRFRRLGRPVTILSLQTTLLPLAVASPNALSHYGPRKLYDGVYTLSEKDAARGFVQAVRLWFSFDCEQTVSVTKAHGALGLKPLRQQDGWIVVQALPGSPAFDAGMRSDEAFLTHVNGVDVSPRAFPAAGLQQSQAATAATTGQTHVSWKDNVIPLVDKCETCIFTFF